MVSNDGSRFGFRGFEDLGGGTHAIFAIESGFAADTGMIGSALFSRQSWVGLGSNTWGDILLGRNYAPMDDDAY